jgi:hypothetical protein
MKSILRLTALALALTLCAHGAHAQAEIPVQAQKAMQPAPAVKKGVTWGAYPIDPTTGTITVSCQGAPGAACNAYNGDTPGNVKLPVLCFNKLGQPFPVPNSMPNSQAAYWSSGVVATTPAVSPIQMGWLGQPRAQVDAYCASQFGPGWVVAEHHMGQNHGWKFGAFGNVGHPGQQRFWVDVKNQPNANIWN